jgi:hypothetical protein
VCLGTNLYSRPIGPSLGIPPGRSVINPPVWVHRYVWMFRLSPERRSAPKAFEAFGAFELDRWLNTNVREHHRWMGRRRVLGTALRHCGTSSDTVGKLTSADLLNHDVQVITTIVSWILERGNERITCSSWRRLAQLATCLRKMHAVTDLPRSLSTTPDWNINTQQRGPKKS